ncbi:serine hydrolase domain-containing protein [Labrenzia sp. OB1]|uniref:serine hydrolase domain-containing protein n=1 Tax=Labrenzia sp. OB1 TaxID=1561204 RepID=UPI001AD8AD9F|nr:serine hydrolase domain-containing protein [Labrenzia sp. OB1]
MTPGSGRTLVRLVLGVILAWGAMMEPAAARTQHSWQARLGGFVDGLVTTELDREAVAGAVVVIVSGDDVVLSRGYRLSDVRTGRLFSPDEDIVPLASVTKVFTALAILQLVKEGRIALDDPVTQYLPGLELAQPYGDINVRHLLSHTAGLEERYSGYFATRAGLGTPSRIAQISAILPRQIRAPEDVIAYSNASYVLLGEIVAQVTGQPYSRYVADTVLAPMGIDDAHFMHERASDNGPGPFHVWSAGRYIATDPSPFEEIHTSSGGLALTAGDMGRIMQVLLKQGSIGKTGAIADMQRIALPGRGEFEGRALGYWTETWAGHKVFHHGGTHFGFQTNMVLIPSLDLGFFVAANGPSGGALRDLPRRVLREVISPEARTLTAGIKSNLDQLQDYTGRFITTRRNESGLDRLRIPDAHIIDIRLAENGRLLVSGLGYSKLFHKIGEDRFETQEGDLRLGFLRTAAGGVSIAHFNGGIYSFERLGYWHREVSLQLGTVAALAGSLLCLAGAFGAWRSKRTLLRTSFWLGITWLLFVPANTVALNSVLNGRDVSSQATAGAGLWAASGLFAAAVASLIWAGIWLTRTHGTVNAGKGDRVLVLAALPLFAWVLVTAWMWNVPTAALTW